MTRRDMFLLPPSSRLVASSCLGRKVYCSFHANNNNACLQSRKTSLDASRGVQDFPLVKVVKRQWILNQQDD